MLRACRKIRDGGIPLKAVNIHEEADPQEQLEGLESQVVDLVAATPGRLSKLNILKGDLLSRVTFAVSLLACLLAARSDFGLCLIRRSYGRAYTRKRQWPLVSSFLRLLRRRDILCLESSAWYPLPHRS